MYSTALNDPHPQFFLGLCGLRVEQEASKTNAKSINKNNFFINLNYPWLKILTKLLIPTELDWEIQMRRTKFSLKCIILAKKTRNAYSLSPW